MQDTTDSVCCETMKNRRMVFHYSREISARGRLLPAEEYTRNGANKKFTSRLGKVRPRKNTKSCAEKGAHQAGD
jgi:hypothetical protein